jgi:hypothetical protein
MNEQKEIPQSNDGKDELNTGLSVVSFCIPIVGAVLYFANKDTKPNSAKTACHAALWGLGVNMFIGVVMAIIGQASA